MVSSAPVRVALTHLDEVEASGVAPIAISTIQGEAVAGADHQVYYVAVNYEETQSRVKSQSSKDLKALTKIDSLREPAYLRTWFYRILLNESMNHFRRGRRLVPLEDTLADRAAPETDPGLRLDLYDALERLDLKEQTVIRLRFFEDMKLEEIALATHTNLNTVKSRLYKGLRKLRELTGEELNDA